MAYNSTVKLTKEKILEKVSESQLFQYYLGYNPELFKRYTNPLRVDKTPGCEFKYRDGKLRFVDYANNLYEDCFGIIMLKNNCNYPQALEQIARDFGLYGYGKGSQVTNFKLEPKIFKEKDRTRFRIRFRKWNQIDANYWKNYYIDRKALEYFNIRPVHAAWVNDYELPFYIYTDTDPCYVYMFPDKTIKLYFPLRKRDKFRNNSTYIQGYSQLPEKGEICFITKSMKDVICMYMFGICAIAPPSENYTLEAEIIVDLRDRFTYVYSLYDWDRTGIRGALQLYNDYGINPLFFTCSGITKIKKDFNAKDFSDNVKKYGYQDMLDIIQYIEAMLMFNEDYNFNEVPF